MVKSTSDIHSLRYSRVIRTSYALLPSSAQWRLVLRYALWAFRGADPVKIARRGPTDENIRNLEIVVINYDRVVVPSNGPGEPGKGTGTSTQT